MFISKSQIKFISKNIPNYGKVLVLKARAKKKKASSEVLLRAGRKRTCFNIRKERKVLA